MRGQHQEGQQHAEREDEDCGVAGKDLLVGQLGPFVAHAIRQLSLEQTLHGRLGLTGAVARCGGTVDLGGEEAVVVHHPIRTGAVRDVDEGR